MTFKQKEYYKLIEHPTNGKYILNIDYDLNPLGKMESGGYAVFPARLIGFDFVTYLRFCRDCLGAEVNGKECRYPRIYFARNMNTLAFIRLLNSRMSLIMFHKKNPNYEIHKQVVENHKKLVELYSNYLRSENETEE